MPLHPADQGQRQVACKHKEIVELIHSSGSAATAAHEIGGRQTHSVNLPPVAGPSTSTTSSGND